MAEFEYTMSVPCTYGAFYAEANGISAKMPRIVIATADWPGPFGDPQTNNGVLPAEPLAKTAPQREMRVGE